MRRDSPCLRIFGRSPTRAAVLALALGAAAAAAAEVIPPGKWVRIETPHFEIYSNTSVGKVEDLAVEIDRMRQVLEWVAGSSQPVSGRPLTIVIFRNEASFRPYMQELPPRGTTRSWEGGASRARSYLLLNGSRGTGDLLPWVYSAYASHFFVTRYPSFPFWFRAGLTAFYETARIDKRGRVRLGLPHTGNLRTLYEYSLVPLAQFFRISQGSEYRSSRQGAVQFQAQAWLVSHYLMTGGGKNPALLTDFLLAVGAGLSEEEAIRRVFGQELEAFESDLRLYMSRRTLPAFALDDVELAPLSAQPVPMDPLEVAYQLGLYLASAHRPPSAELAEQHLLPLTDGGPRAADALAALGMLRRETGLHAEATSLFERAVQRQPREASSYFFAGLHFQETGAAAREQVQACFERAVELDPGLGEAWARLGHSYGPDDTEKAVRALRKALELTADRPDLAYNLAITYLEQGNVAGAREVAEGYLATAERRELRERLLREIERVEQHRVRQRHADLYNEAVRLFNELRYEEARVLLDELLESVDDPRLEEAASDLLETVERLAPRAKDDTA